MPVVRVKECNSRRTWNIQTVKKSPYPQCTGTGTGTGHEQEQEQEQELQTSSQKGARLYVLIGLYISPLSFCLPDTDTVGQARKIRMTL